MNKTITPSILPQIFSDELKIEQKSLPLYNVTFVGHVDAGKSTTATRILYDSGCIDSHLLDQYAKEAATYNKESFKFAFFFDRQKEERKRGITIDINHAEWATKNRYFTIIDAPGHRDFIKNMIVGASQADLIVLVVDSKKGLLEAVQTEEHAILARASGISSVVVALTKIDTIPSEIREATVKERIEECKALLQRSGYMQENIIYVPIDSWNGVNIIHQDKNPEVIPWYNGPTLIEALDTIPLEEPDKNLPFRLSIENVCTRIGGTSCVLTGKIMSGSVRPLDEVIIKPSNVKGIVRSIQMHHKELKYAVAGCNVGIDVKNVKEEDLERGSVLCHLNDRPVKGVSEFTLEKAVIRKHPSEICVGHNLIVHFQTGTVCCSVKSIKNVIEISTKKQTPGDCKSIKPGSIGDLVLVPEKPIAVETKEAHPRNSKIVLRDSGQTIGWGSIKSVILSKFEV